MTRFVVVLFHVLAVSLPIANSARGEETVLRVGIVGCDTSHVIAFTNLINDPKATGSLAKVQVTVAFPGGSPDIASSRDRLAGFVNQLRQRGVTIVDSIEQLAEQSDAILLESVDGRVHLEQFRAVARGKPVFIDKPAAASLADVLLIFRHADATNTPCFSSSALRFCDEVQALANDKNVGEVVGCETVCPMHVEPAHPDLFWYGVHGVESLFTILGAGCESVNRVDSDSSTVVAGKWSDGRIGTYRGLKNGDSYAATLYGNKGVSHRAGFSGYGPLVERICDFFVTRKVPVSRQETIEMFAFMEAADESKRLGGQPVKLADIIARAEAEANRQANRPPETAVDVVVYGGTSAGIIAAIQAQADGQERRAHRAVESSGRSHDRRPGRDRHRQQGGDRRPGARLLSPHLDSTMRTTPPGCAKRATATTPAMRATIRRTTRCGRSSRTSPRTCIARCWPRPASRRS